MVIINVFGYNDKEVGKLYLNVATIVVLISLVSYFVINALHVRKIRRISMTEALKNRE